MVKHFTWMNELIYKFLKGQMGAILEIIIKLNGGRKAGKTGSELEAGINMLILPYKIEVNIWRYESKGADETWNEIRSIAHQYGIPDKNMSSRTLTHPVTGNKLKVRNYKSNKKKKVGKLGLERGRNLDLVVNIIDEVSEFESQSEIQAIYEALSDAPKSIKIESQNPFLPQHFWTKEFSKHCKGDEHTMRKYGYKLVSKHNKEAKTLEIWDRTNHRVNQYLSEREHNALERIWDYDPQRARVSDLGLDGVEGDTIYNRVMKTLFVASEIPPKRVESYNGGIDWGHTSGATICGFGWTKRGFTGDHTNDILVYFPKHRTFYSSFIGEMEYKPLNDTEKAGLIIDFYQRAVRHYEIDTRNHEIEIAVDYGNPTFIELLNNIAKVKGIDEWLIFHEATKDKIPTRVKRTLLMGGFGAVTINKSRCPYLYDEFSLARYSDNPTASNYRIGEDHGQDMIEYKVKKNSTKILNALPEEVSLGARLDELYGHLIQKHERN